ncbi:Asp-tRNA(Asn)/Glu-tRNA(Gln) amidotransferase subunit GatA [Evansella clarkii]|uniref:Asp-tRNA(Asn)/Glu-tRNA(Gln) amidotransferase subunit GatA n=1 Tax=Evansella clarkii TaxID=79879 RepID=UPI0009972B53|nr:Asp-tRNA(Asn)/Glu-tRNA(Gln) amidotransferase subunit GatA [Evansella clarkii]
MSLFDHSIDELHQLLHKKEISVSDLTEESIQRVNEVGEKVGSFLHLSEEGARKKASELDEILSSDGIKGSLFGIPGGIKDNIMTKGMPTTCASKLLDGHDPVYDATVMNLLNKENFVNIGKLNMDEFAMGSSTENSGYKLTRNPWNTDRVPGGSSGGSAAAVASGEVLFSLGSDTGGSIREPAAFCGIVGMKPTYGRVSRYGLVAFASSLDQIGPMTRTVKDNALVLNAISGHDHFDSTSVNESVPDYSEVMTGDIKGLKVALPKEYITGGVHEEVREQILKAVKRFEELGAVVEEVSLPHSQYATAAYYVIASSEASANLARFDGVRYGQRVEGENLIEMYKKTRSEGFGDEVKRRIMLGTFALSSGFYDEYYKKAQKVRTLIKQDFEEIFLNYDVVIGPTSPTTAFKLGDQVDEPLTMYANDVLTIPVNLAGVPGISVPCGLGKDTGMPVGLQIIGNHFDEKTVYKAAYAFEQATEFNKQKPEL